MTDALTYTTPNKQSLSDLRGPETAERSPEPVTLELDVRVDYKAKTYKLMKQLTEAQVINKKSYIQIKHLQMEVDAFKKEFQQIFTLLGVKSLENCYRTIEELSRGQSKISQQKAEEWANIIQDYKKIINTQQYKYIKLEQQFKISQVKLKRYEQQNEVKDKNGSLKQLKEKSNINTNIDEINRLKEESFKYKESAELKDKECKSLSEQLVLLKRQYKQLLMDRENIKEMYQQLQSKYSLQIQHFQEMEKHVQERLLQVQREMNFYRFEREGHLQKIQLMKQEINLNETKAFFSFGGVAHIGLQTEYNQELSSFNHQCLEISIKTLLEENEKLKNTLLLLYTNPVGQQLPKDIELELKILLNMHDASVKYLKRQDKSRKTEVFEPISSKSQSTVKQKINKENISFQQDTKEQSNVQAQSWQSIQCKFGVENRILQVNEQNAEEETQAQKEMPPLQQLP